jgi:hypothetical protein
VARAPARRYHGGVADVGKPPEEVLPPRFEVLSTLGAGGMGEVFSVLDRESGARTALKLLARPGGAWASRFRHEFRCVADLRHPNLVRLGELFEHAGRWCYTMELVDGVDFLDWVLLPFGGGLALDEPSHDPTLRGDPLAAPTVRRYDERRLRDAIAQLADGLAAIHAVDIVHRDVKPSNVMVTPDGRVVLLDFGIATPARVADDGELAVGTVDYMAPEQARAEQAAPPADMYSVGCMIYEVLVGRPPFEGPIMDILLRKQREDPSSPRSLFPETAIDLDVLCMELLDRDPERRPTARQVAERLRRALPAPTVAPVVGADDDALLGRDDELAALLDGLDDAGPGVHVVLGVAGIGKSALLIAVARAAHDRGARVTVGRCHEREHVMANAWDALFEALTRDLAALPRAKRTPLLPADVVALARAFPSFERVVPVGSGGSVPASELAARARVALRGLLERLTADQPIVMIVDDAQWATTDSYDLLAAVMAPPAPRLHVVLAARPSTGTGATLRERIGQLGRLGVTIRTTVLDPLPTSVMRTLAARRLPADRVDGAVAAAHGNPLLLALATGAEAPDPTTDVTAALVRRVAALPATERDVLAVAALAPGPVRHDVIDRVLGVAAGASLDIIAELRHQRLVRTTGTGRADRVEPLHDAVRRAAVEAVSARIQARLQRRLAEAIEADPSASPATRCAAWIGAGDGPRAAAGVRALVAAARHSFELAHAALVCESVLALPLAADDRAAVQAALGEAWAGAGDGARAADAFHAAAASAAEPTARLALLRRGAEHDIRAGNLGRGRAAAATVGAALGLADDASPGRVKAQSALERTRLRLRGLELHDGAIDRGVATEAETCRALASALSIIDTQRAGYFQARGLRLALDSGDPALAARGLGLEATFVAIAGGSAHEPRARRLLERASELAARAGRDDADASVLAATALCDLAVGDHASALAGSDAAATLFRERCTGATWDGHRQQVVALWALAWLGRWGELARRRELLAREAEATADHLALTLGAVGFPTCVDVAADTGAAARERIDQLMRRWGDDVQTPHFHRLIADATLDLGAGDGERAVRRLDERQAALADSVLLRGDWFRAILADLRSRAALAAGRLDEAARAARRAARVPWANAPARLTQAAILAAGGRSEEAAAHFEQAATACDHAGLAMHAAAALDRRGALVGGDTGDELRGRAARRAIELGAAVPERAFQLLVPLPRKPS